MEINEGDLVVTLPKAEQIPGIIDKLKAGMIGVVTESSPKFDDSRVYGVLIDGREYYLFEDEIKKWEKS